MGLFSGLARLVPGFRHIAAGRTVAGLAWFTAFAAFLNFGLLAPLAWPAREMRVARVVLCGAALVVAVAAHRRAARVERLERRRADRLKAEAGSAPRA